MTMASVDEKGTKARSESFGSRRYFSISLMMSSGEGIGDTVRRPLFNESKHFRLESSSYRLIVNSHAYHVGIIWDRFERFSSRHVAVV